MNMQSPDKALPLLRLSLALFFLPLCPSLFYMSVSLPLSLHLYFFLPQPPPPPPKKKIPSLCDFLSLPAPSLSLLTFSFSLHLLTLFESLMILLHRLATERDPDLVKAFIALGQISCSRGSLDEATHYFELALSKVLSSKNFYSLMKWGHKMSIIKSNPLSPVNRARSTRWITLSWHRLVLASH